VAIGPGNLDQVVALQDGYSQSIRTALSEAGLAPVDSIKSYFSDLALSPDGRYVAVAGCGAPLDVEAACTRLGGQDGGLRFVFILDAKTGTVVSSIPIDERIVRTSTVAFTPDGNRLIFAFRSGSLAVWDISSAEIAAELAQLDPNTEALDLSVSPDGRWAAYVAMDLTSYTAVLKVLDLETGDLVMDAPIQASNRYEQVAETNPSGWGPQFSRDGRSLLVPTDHTLLIYDTSTWDRINSIPNPCPQRCNLAASPDLSTLVVLEAETKVAGPPAAVTVWDLSSGERVQDLTDGLVFASPLTFSPDGRLLFGLTAPPDYIVAWDAADEWRLLDLGDPFVAGVIYYREFARDGRSFLQWDEAGVGLFGLKPGSP
jgi:WD40 repeat protein